MTTTTARKTAEAKSNLANALRRLDAAQFRLRLMQLRAQRRAGRTS